MLSPPLRIIYIIYIISSRNNNSSSSQTIIVLIIASLRRPKPEIKRRNQDNFLKRFASADICPPPHFHLFRQTTDWNHGWSGEQPQDNFFKIISWNHLLRQTIVISICLDRRRAGITDGRASSSRRYAPSPLIHSSTLSPPLESFSKGTESDHGLLSSKHLNGHSRECVCQFSSVNALVISRFASKGKKGKTTVFGPDLHKGRRSVKGQNIKDLDNVSYFHVFWSIFCMNQVPSYTCRSDWLISDYG